MNSRQLEYILMVAREGSVTLASKRLFISQPALSQSIKQIESELGAPLFDRSTEPISLTFAGRRYVEAAQRILDIERNLRLEISGSEDAVHARMRLGISNQRGMQILPLVVPEYNRQYPYIRLDLVEHGSDTLERLTAEGECDISLVTTSKRSTRLQYVLIENEEVVLMAAKTTRLAQTVPEGTPIDISTVTGEKFVSMTEGHSIRIIQDRLFERYHISPRIIMESNNMEAAKHVAALSDAVMLIPRVYVDFSPALAQQVQCYPILSNDYERHFYLCFRKGMRLTSYMEDFVRIVCAKLGVPFSMPGEDVPVTVPLHRLPRPTGE